MNSVLATSGFSVAYGGAVIDVPAFALATGEDAAIVCPSVVAGDRAARCLIGLAPVAGGSIELFGRPLADTSPRELLRMRRRLAFAPSDPAFLSTVPVPDNVSIPLRDRQDLSDAELNSRALARLSELGVEIVGRVLPAALTRPDRWLAGFARATLAEPELLVVAEPPLALSDDQFARFVKRLEATRESTKTAVVLLSAENLNARRGFANIVDATLRTAAPGARGMAAR